MKRHEDPFFEMFREGLQTYEATPSAEVYAGVQSQLSKGGFFRFSWYQFNMYYLALLLGAATLAILSVSPSDTEGTHAAYAFEQVEAASQRSVWSEPVADVSKEITNQVTTPTHTTAVRNEKATRTFAAKKGNAKELMTAPETTAVAESKESNSPELIAENSQPRETEQAAPEQAASISCEEIQLPTNWAQSLTSPDLQSLVDQLDSDAEVLYLTLPVKIEVDEKE